MARWTSMRDMYNSKAASAVTSEEVWVGDADKISLQLLGSPSTTTVQGSNATGFSTAIGAGEWSTITTLGVGMYAMEPGVRWLRCQRSETTNVYLAQQQPW